MAKSKSTGSARTAPKGRATAPRNRARGRSGFLAPWMEWALAILLFVAIAVVLFLVFGDARPASALDTPFTDVAAATVPAGGLASG